jgi:hypothetical protein
MKQYRFFYFLLLVTLVFTSCTKDESKQYYQVLGTVSKTVDSTIIIADDDVRLLVQNQTSLSSLDSSDRIIAYFSINEQTLPAGIDYVIEIYNYSKVLYKPVVDLTQANADSIGSDALEVRDMWVAKNFMNLNFEYYGNNQIHRINLVRIPGNISSDTVQLEVRHNDNNDAQLSLMSGFVSFNLEGLKKEAADSVVLHVKAKEYNSRVFDKYFTYKY